MKFNLSEKFGLEKGFKQFLVKTVGFIGIFALIQFLVIPLQKISLPNQFYPFLDPDLGKVFLFVTVLFILFSRKKLSGLNSYKLRLKNTLMFGSLTLVSLITYFYYKNFAATHLGLALEHLIFFVSLRYFFFIFILIFLALTVFGIEFLKDFIKRFKKEILFFILLFIVIYYFSMKIQELWFYFSFVVAKAVYFMLTLTSEVNLYFNGKMPIMRIGSFIVGIDSPCSGIESLFLFAALYLFILVLDWKVLNKKKIFILFIPGVLSVFVLNIIRIYFLIIIGAYLSSEFALGVFHTNISWILFLAYFTIFWLFFYNWMKNIEFKRERKHFIKRVCSKIISDSLYKNSIYLIISTFTISFLGFVFWMINTRLFTIEQIGLATTIISITSLITSFSLLGLGSGLVRYLPKSKRKSQKINTCFTLSAIVTVIVTTFFLLSLEEISPKILFIKENVILSFVFIIFMVFSSLSSLMDSVFVAYRSAKYIVLKNSIFGVLKLIFPFLLVSLGAYGIFGSYMIPMIIGVITGFIILVYKLNYEPKFVFYDTIIRKIGRYSFGNYVAGFISNLPSLLLPLIITNSLHPEITAYYFIAMMIANTLFIIPSATSNSLFAEGSHNQKNLKKQVKKATKIIAAFLIPAIIITIFFGRYILMLFGQAYSDEGYGFLNLLAFSGIFVSINYIFTSVFNVKKRVKEIIFRSLIGSLVILGLSYLFIQHGLGLLGIGYAWLIGQAIISLVFFVMWIREK